MILQDNSGEMCEPIQATDSAGNSCVSVSGTGPTPGFCSVCEPGDTSPPVTPADCSFGGANPPACASKMQLTSYVMNQVLGGLQSAPGSVYLGLSNFPGSANQGECAAGAVVVPIGHAADTVPAIDDFYQGIVNVTGGGGPLAATVTGIASGPVLGNATLSHKYLVLITGGLPNCDSSNPCATEPWSDGQTHGCESTNLVAGGATPPSGCACSFGGCSSPPTCCPAPGGGIPAGDYCIDGPASVAAVANLYDSYGVQTYVVGMGLEWEAAENSSILQQIAAAGHGSSFVATDPASLQMALQSLFQELSGG
jgi:hypothetical protein